MVIMQEQLVLVQYSLKSGQKRCFDDSHVSHHILLLFMTIPKVKYQEFLIPYGDWSGHIGHLADGLKVFMADWILVKEMVIMMGCLSLQVLLILQSQIHTFAKIKVTLLLFILVTTKVRLITSWFKRGILDVLKMRSKYHMKIVHHVSCWFVTSGPFRRGVLQHMPSPTHVPMKLLTMRFYFMIASIWSRYVPILMLLLNR